MSNTYQIQMVCLDLWQTLIRSNPAYKAQRVEIMAKFLDYKGDLNTLNQIIKSVNSTADNLTDKDCVQRGFYYRVGKIYNTVTGSEQTTLPDKLLKELANEVSILIENHPPLLIEPDLQSTLSNLKHRGYKIAVISNTGFTDGNQMRIALQKLQILSCLDYLIFSDEVDISKPHSKIFETLTCQANIPANQILHIGDNFVADYEGATAAGFQAAVFKNKKNESACVTRPSIQSIKSLLTLLN